MFPPFPQMRAMLKQAIADRRSQGHDISGAEPQLSALPDSYDAMLAFARSLNDLPMRADWKYVQPDGWAGVVAEMHPSRASDPIAPISLADAAERARAGFLGSVCGCILGKPLEIFTTLAGIRGPLSKIGNWPMNDYVSIRARDEGGLNLHESWPETTRENIRHVAPDDDVNYTILGMVNLERNGLGFTRNQLRDLWLRNVVTLFCWGPERTILLRAGCATLGENDRTPVDDATIDAWTSVLNPGDGLCGAMIRADAYGYACPGRPMLAAELAFRDASLTHRRTGAYGTMFAAAAIAIAFVERDPVRIFDLALHYVPRRSRFAAIVRDAIGDVRSARTWEEGYDRIHAKYAEFGHCRVYQESATLINTLRFAASVGDGICKQVMQGNDTDSYGATAGSILGCFFGPEHLEARWIEPFNDKIHTTLADFHEQSLARVAERMSQLPKLTLGGGA